MIGEKKRRLDLLGQRKGKVKRSKGKQAETNKERRVVHLESKMH